jgi:glycosyltransferase involved in cell wall biosynthesis
MHLKKVIYIGPFELPDNNAAANRVTGVAEILNMQGIKVSYIEVTKTTKSESGQMSQQVTHPHTLKINSKTKKLQIARYLFGSVEIDKEIIKNSKQGGLGVVCYNYPAFAQLRIIILSKIFKFKVIADVTEWYSSDGLSLFQKLAKQIDTDLRIKIINRLCDGLILISPTFEKYYHDFKGPCILLPPIFKKNLAIKSFDVRQQTRYIYMGTPFDVSKTSSMSKGSEKDKLSQIIGSFAQAKEKGAKFTLLIGGITQDNYIIKYPMDQDKIAYLANNINFLGKLPHQIALYEVANSDFTIFLRDPKRVNLYGFPSKLGESISVGTPVITNYLPNLVNLVTKEWLLKTEEKYLAQLVIELSRNQHTDKRKIILSKALAENYFEPSHYTDQMGNFLMAVSDK